MHTRKNHHFLIALILALFVPSIVSAGDLVVGVPFKSKVTIAIVSDDASKARIIDSLPIVENAYSSCHLSSAISLDKHTLVYTLGGHGESEVKQFSGEIKTVGVTMAPIFNMPGSNQLVFGRPPISENSKNSDLPSLLASTQPQFHWSIYEIDSGRTTTILDNQPSIWWVRPFFKNKFLALKLNYGGLEFQPLIYELSSGSIIPSKYSLKGEEDFAFDATAEKLAALNSQCALQIISGNSVENFKIPPPDYSCRGPVWSNTDELLLSASGVGGSRYGASYSVKSFNLKTKALTTLIQGDAHIFYKLLGIRQNGDLVVIGHGLDRTPKYSLELYDGNGKKKQTLFGSENEIGFLGELDGYDKQLLTIDAGSSLAVARDEALHAKVDNAEIRSAAEKLLAPSARPFPASFYPSVLLAAESKDNNVRQRAMQELQSMSVGLEKKMAVYEKLAGDPDKNTRSKALSALAEMGAAASPAVDTILEQLERLDEWDQAHAILTISKIEISARTEKIVPVLKRLLENHTPSGADLNSMLFVVERFGTKAVSLSDQLIPLIKKLEVPKDCLTLNRAVIVPTLKAALAVGTPEARSGVQDYISKSRPTLERCIHRAKNDMTTSDLDALHYIAAFKELGAPFVPPILKELTAKSNSESVDTFRIRALRETLEAIGTEQARKGLEDYAEKLSAELQQENADINILAQLSALGAYAEPAIPELIKRLDQPESNQWLVTTTLGEINSPSSRKALLDYAKLKRRPDIFREISTKEVDISTLPVISNYLRDSDSQVRLNAREALSKIASEAEKSLINGEMESELSVASGHVSATSAARSFEEEEMELYKKWKKEAAAEPKRYPLLAKIFSGIGANEPFLFSNEATIIYTQMGYLRGEDAVETLFRLISGSDPNMARFAAAALPYLGVKPEKIVSRLIDLLNKPGSWSRLCAVTGLGGFINQSKEAKRIVESLKDDSDVTVKSEAQRQLNIAANIP